MDLRRNLRAHKERNRQAKSANATPSIPKVYGCPVPDPIRCFSGEPVLLGSDGVKMECSNEKCPFENALLHQECFDALEDHLVKILNNHGPAKGWTDAQKRANLWDKKGQSLIAKVCRCRCGLGLTKMDELAAYDRLQRKAREEEEARRQAALAAGLPPPTMKKKRKPKNDLPKLNFGGVRIPHRLFVEEREPRAILHQHGAELRDMPTSSVSPAPTGCPAFELRRESLTCGSSAWSPMSTLLSEDSTQSVISGRDSVDDTTPDGLKNGFSLNADDDAISNDSRNDFSQGSFNVLESDNDIELKSRPTTSPDCFEPVSSDKDLASHLKFSLVICPPRKRLPSGSAQDQTSLNFMSSDLTALTQTSEKQSTRSDGEATSVPEWDLFKGRDFDFGEKILADFFLPLWSNKNRSDVPADF